MDPTRELLPVLTGQEMRDWELRAFAGGAISERVVLESAGRAVAQAVADYFPDGKVVAAVGRGNNGGDAIVALRTLLAWGREVAAFGSPDSAQRIELTHGWDVPFHEAVEEACRGAGVVLDGILGTGASGAPRDAARMMIRAMNEANAPVVAVDGPSGVDLATGATVGEAVQAEMTVTFGTVKQGLLLHPGREHAGRILLAEVGFPPFDERRRASVITDRWAREHLPQIPPDAHKGRTGIVAVAAGRHGFAGAAVMAAMGALRTGAGGVRLVSTEDNRELLQTAVPEALFVGREDVAFEERLAGIASALVGPGIGVDDAGEALLRRILHLRVPSVLDADALSLLAERADLRTALSQDAIVLTPHPGELGRLLGCSTSEILADRPGSARDAAERFDAVVLAKGTPSLVAIPDGTLLFGTTGHSGLATGGMGDTLGGVIAALLAAGLKPAEAAAVGLHFAGRAAEVAGQGRGLLPRDVAEALPEVLAGGSPSRSVRPFLLNLPAVY